MTQTTRSGLWGIAIGVCLLGAVWAGEATFRGVSPYASEFPASVDSGSMLVTSPSEPAMELSGLVESIEDHARWNMNERIVFRCEYTDLGVGGIWLCGYGVELVPRQRK